MAERQTPQPGKLTIRDAALKAVGALDAIVVSLDERKPRLNAGYSNPIQQQAHDNLAIAREVAAATGTYYALTRRRLLLEEASSGPYERGPYISLSPGQQGTGEVTILTRKHNLPLTDKRIDKIFGRDDRPEATLLVTRLGRSTPRQIIDKAKRQVSRDTKKSRLASLGFHIFGK